MKKIIGLYYIGVLCDLLSTYLVTPDLATEKSPVIVYFNLSWLEIVVLAFLFITLVSYLSIRLYPFLQQADIKGKRNAAYFIISVLHFHLLFSYFAAFNNLIGYAFLHADKRTFLWAVAERYTYLAYNYMLLFYGAIAAVMLIFAVVLVRRRVRVLT